MSVIPVSKHYIIYVSIIRARYIIGEDDIKRVPMWRRKVTHFLAIIITKTLSKYVTIPKLRKEQ